MIIYVEQHDINEGIAMNCRRCPVARAINRVLLNGITCVTSQSRTSLISESDTLLSQYLTPIEAKRFMTAFDCGHHLEPFSFVLDIPEHFVKREWWLKSKKELTEAERKELFDILYYKQDL